MPPVMSHCGAAFLCVLYDSLIKNRQTVIERSERTGRSFLQPRKEPKEAALSPLLLLGFPPTGFYAYHRSRTRPASLAARCALRTAEHRKKPPKTSEPVFDGFLCVLLSGNSLGDRIQTGENKFGFYCLLHRQLESRGRSPLAQSSRPRRPRTFPLRPISV